MSAAQALETPAPTTQEVQAILKDIADLLCPAHEHKITGPSIKPSEKINHSMVIACRQEGDIIWQVGMSANCLVKIIRRCKVLYISELGVGRSRMTTFKPLGAWEGLQCDDILRLLHNGHLQEGWWEDNASRLSDQRLDKTQKPSEAGSNASGSHNYVAYPTLGPEQHVELLGGRDMDGQEETRRGRQGRQRVDYRIVRNEGWISWEGS